MVELPSEDYVSATDVALRSILRSRDKALVKVPNIIPVHALASCLVF